MKATLYWHTPTVLLLLGALNILSGSVALGTLLEGPTVENLSGEFASPHYFSMPLPIVLHLVSGILFNLISPFQFAVQWRRRYPGMHRALGRALVVCGLMAAGTGLWMNQFFPSFGTGLKYSAVLLFSIGMMISLTLGLLRARQGNIAAHRHWMLRAIAIGLAPSVQRLILLPLFAVLGGLPMWLIEGVVWLSFAGSVCLVEWLLRREFSVRVSNPAKSQAWLPAPQ